MVPFLFYLKITFTVNVLYSQKHDQIDIGFTSDMKNRFLPHKELATKGHTIKYLQWAIAYTEECTTESDAMNKKLS